MKVAVIMNSGAGGVGPGGLEEQQKRVAAAFGAAGVVVTREAVRRRSGRSKGWAMLIAAGRVLSRFPLLKVREYAINALTLGQRPRLDRGLLSLYLVRGTGRLKLFWVMVRALLQRLDVVRDFETRAVTELRVELPRRRLQVALDGDLRPGNHHSGPQPTGTDCDRRGRSPHRAGASALLSFRKTAGQPVARWLQTERRLQPCL